MKSKFIIFYYTFTFINKNNYSATKQKSDMFCIINGNNKEDAKSNFERYMNDTNCSEFYIKDIIELSNNEPNNKYGIINVVELK